MWINSEVDLPDHLVSAQREGRLVVFAGAGISMGAPSNLPNFEALAIDLAGGGIELEPEEPLDRFLGRVEARGTNIQARARAVLDNPLSQPREIHSALCQLFRSPSDFRLITTNFDRHLTTALRRERGEAVPVYHAPALPLGHDFAGLVYLHGAIEHPSHRLVLSDADFGRAYLTEGWATRFLYEVFRTYSVLFVGYSHRDPVIRYIARSLQPGGSSRFALISAGDDGPWQYFGVKAIRYPLREPPERHAALDGGIRDWVNTSRMGVFDHEHRIRKLVALPPPVEKTDVDYIEDSCRDASKLQFFITVAGGSEWLEWIAKRGFLKSLFIPEEELDECGRLFARWLIDSYAVELAQPLFDLIQEAGGKLNREVWFGLTHSLTYWDPRPTRQLLATWLLILVGSADPSWHHVMLDQVLRSLKEPEDGASALLLWNHLAAFRAKLVRPWHVEQSEPRIRIELHTLGDKHDLQDCWRQYFLPNLGDLYPELTVLLTSMLQQAHVMMRVSGEARDGWDSTSLRRAAIEPHEQNSSLHDIDVLIDAARDLIEWLLANQHSSGVGLRGQWLGANTPVLRRLGIHAMTVDDQVPVDEAVTLIVTRGWLYELGVKHEVFQLLKAKYGLAGEAVRRQLLTASLADALPGEDEDARRTSAYERFNLAGWLHEAAPDCPFTTAHFQKLQEESPTFVRRSHPDLSSWGTVATWVGPKSPVSVDELLAKSPSEAVPWLATYEGKQGDFDGPDRHGLLAVVRESVGRNWTWTVAIMEGLQQDGIWISDLWGALLDGLAAAQHAPEEWEAIVEILDRMPELAREAGRDLLDLLQKFVEEDAAKVRCKVVLRAMSIARRAVEGGEHGDTVMSGDQRDWLALAINHVGGKAAIVTVQSLAKLRQLGGESWVGIPAEVKGWLEDLCGEQRIDAQRARTVLASHFHFFFGLDREWTTQVLLPLFDWDRDAGTAEQAWYGYLTWGRWNDAVLEALRPSLEASFARITTNLSELRDAFTTRLAGIALYAAADPWHDGWLMKFISDTDDLGLRSWAWAMGNALRELKPDALTAVWSRWMNDYWAARATGVPRLFADEELGAMLDWIPGLLPVLPQAVELFISQPVHLPQHSRFLFGLRESPAIASHPIPIATLLAHLLRHANRLGYECGYAAEITRKLHEAGADRDVLRGIVESLARLGCADAVPLRVDLGV